MRSTRMTRDAAWQLLLSVFVALGCLNAGTANPAGAAETATADVTAPDVTEYLSALTAASGDSKGIYSLQDSLRFDNLRTAVYDPQHKSLTLLGDRRSEQWLVPIPYLDHLATAIESDNPTFTLPWTDEADRQWNTLVHEAGSSSSALWDRIVRNARRQLFDQHGLLTEQGLRILRTLPFPADGFEAGKTNKYEIMAKAVEVCGGEQQALLMRAYGRSLRGAKYLDPAVIELAMSNALDATMTDDYSAELWEIFIQRFAGVFETDEQTAVGIFRRARQRRESIVAARNIALEHILASLDASWEKIFSNSLELSATHKPYVFLPPDLVRSLAGITISVRPIWHRIRPESRLAEVMFHADLVLKMIVSDPSLLGSDPRFHRTEYEWQKNRLVGTSQAKTSNVRFWISPGTVELAESADGGVLEIRKVALRVSTDDPASQAYADYLTSIMDRLANHLPAIHELIECTKIMAVSEWLQKKDPGFRLPKEGRSEWTPPEEVYGLITIASEVQVNRTDTASETRITGKWTGHATLEGGVSLELGNAAFWDGSATDVVRLDDIRKTVVPEIYDNQALKQVLRQHTIPPPPMPPGATAKADLGQRKLDYIQILEERLGDRADAETTQEALREATRLAEQIRFSDELINELQAGRINALEAFDRAETWARDERMQMGLELFDLFSDVAGVWLGEQQKLALRTNVAEVLYLGSRTPEQRFLVSMRYTPAVKTLLQDIDTARESIRTGESFDRNMALVERSADLFAAIDKAMKPGRASKLLGEVSLFTPAATTLINARYRWLQMRYNIEGVEVLSEQMGNEAQFLGRLQERREKQITKLRDAIQYLERTASK